MHCRQAKPNCQNQKSAPAPSSHMRLHRRLSGRHLPTSQCICNRTHGYAHARTTRRSAAHGYRYSTKRRLLPFAFLLWSKSKQLKPNTQNNIGKVWAAARCICEGRVGVRSFLCSFCGFFLRCLFECVNYSMVTTSSGPWVVRFFTRKQAPFAWWEVGHSTAVRTIVRSCAAIDQCQRRPATRERPTDRLAD